MACVGFADLQGQIHVFEEPTAYYGRLTAGSPERLGSAEGQEVGRAWGGEAGKLFEAGLGIFDRFDVFNSFFFLTEKYFETQMGVFFEC